MHRHRQGIPADGRVAKVFLDVGNDLAGIGLVPVPVQLLGDQTELYGEVSGKVLGPGLTALFLPQPEQCFLMSPMMMRASEPPMKYRRCGLVDAFEVPVISA